jgi:hypothetical protein
MSCARRPRLSLATGENGGTKDAVTARARVRGRGQYR